jgi:hypothetical protein
MVRSMGPVSEADMVKQNKKISENNVIVSNN